MANENYDVGNILINIETKANNITQTLDNTINKLSSLKKTVNGISKLNMDNVHKTLESISRLSFLGIKNAFGKIEIKPIKDFAKSLKTISNLNFNNLDFQKVNYSFNALMTAVDPFVEKMKSAEPALKAFSNASDLGRVNAQLSVAEARIKAINERSQSRKVIDDKKLEKTNYQLEITKKRLDDITKKSDKTRINFNKIFNIGKIYFFANYFKRFATSLVNVTKSAINFNETLNKFQVSMGGYYERSLQFVNSLTKAFNLSTESIMNYQSTFKNMLSSLGNLSGDVSYELSETLTRMALDYASLFNVSTERAMEQFQAVLSGQIRSIRSVSGYDVSETSIFNIYKELGGTKTMRQLDQIEKRLLRIIAVQQQMEQTQALGDFAKTINTTANQLKQLSETFKEIGRWLGQLTMAYMQPFIESLLAGAIAVRELLKALNIAKGYVYEDFGESSIFGEMTESADEANETINALKKNLLGFDKLNILGGNATTETGDYSLLTSKIKEYARSLDEVTNKANEISIKILEWLGYTYDVNGNLTGTGSNLKKILAIVGTLIGTITSTAVFSKISSIITGLEGLGKGNGVMAKFVSTIKSSGFASKLGVIGAIVASLILLYSANEDFRKSVNGLFESIGNGLKPAIKTIANLISNVIFPTLEKIIVLISSTLSPVIKQISPIFSLIGKIFDSLSPVTGTLSKFLGALISVAVQVSTILSPIFMAIESVGFYVTTILEVGLGAVLIIVKSICAVFETIGLIFETIFGREGTDKFKSLQEIFAELGTKIKEIWKGVGITIQNIVWGIAESLIQNLGYVVNSFVKKINTLTSTLSSLWEWTGLPSIPQIPEWDTTLYGKHKVPALANGGIIKQPTVAMVGEYAGANSNPEIVTPENLMRQVFVESMLPIAQIIASGNNEVVGAIEELANRPIEMNGRKLSEAIYDDFNRVSIRKTGRALNYAR